MNTNNTYYPAGAEEKIINAKKLNLLSIPIVLVMLVISSLLYRIINGTTYLSDSVKFEWKILIYFIALLALIGVHELIHGLCYRFIGGSKFRIFIDK